MHNILRGKTANKNMEPKVILEECAPEPIKHSNISSWLPPKSVPEEYWESGTE